MISPSSAHSHGHRRQISTPAPFEVAKQPVLAAMPPRRTHRRGQTVDYGSFSSQMPVVGRRNAPNKVSQLRDYFNEKSGYSRPVSAAPQFSSSQQDRVPFMSHGPPSGLPMVPESSYQTSYTWIPDELVFGTSSGFPSFASSTASSESRSATNNTDDNAPLNDAMYRMRQLREQQEIEQLGSFSPQPTINPNEKTTGYAHSIQQLSVQPEEVSSRINQYLSCESNVNFSFDLDGALTGRRRHFSPYPRAYPIEEFV